VERERFVFYRKDAKNAKSIAKSIAFIELATRDADFRSIFHVMASGFLPYGLRRDRLRLCVAIRSEVPLSNKKIMRSP
jgi:hypothetical protein